MQILKALTLILLAASPATAQVYNSDAITAPTGTVIGTTPSGQQVKMWAMACLDVTNTRVSCGGGGGGGSSTTDPSTGTNQNTQITAEQLIAARLGDVTAPAAGTVNARLGSLFQAGQSIGNTGFAINGNLPAFASTPTFNLGTLNGAATAARQDSLIAGLGTPADAPATTTDTTATSLIAQTKQLVARVNALLAATGSPVQTTTTLAVKEQLRALYFAESTTPLAASGTFNGITRDVGAANPTMWTRFSCLEYSDQAGTSLVSQGSDDGTTWYQTSRNGAPAAGATNTLTVVVYFRYNRCIYTNNATAQTTFVLRSAFSSS